MTKVFKVSSAGERRERNVEIEPLQFQFGEDSSLKAELTSSEIFVLFSITPLSDLSFSGSSCEHWNDIWRAKGEGV